MPLATILAEMLKSGKVTVSANNTEALEIEALDKKIDIKALNKDILKDTLAATRGTEKNKGAFGQLGSVRNSIGMLKEVAEDLSKSGITVTLTYKDSVVVTLGSEANPKLSSIATGTKAIEINSPRKLIELGL
ncbi:MAG: hypothetical protein LBH74_09880 [Nitrososphaerota archaeon]|jgi:hypothetical protein|uniref:hypothetical protein n=1 Tax=Candidatus Bathycorpusculum sp. TaxID=2994959 RepID=UPI002837117F|nr:hypothetical protein [Candidatus Termitimicrobium sp.]MCL2432860.1 hypothetical protein [Candidatus Termitimicrobium sp.]MDR0493923.1 hypothetical protein [Nitrososphaerota archaeon]